MMAIIAMKRKAKTLALLGLGSVVVLGLLYWRFSASESSRAVQRPTTEVFAEAFGKGDFEHCYQLMGEDHRESTSESEFVDNLKTYHGAAVTQILGTFENLDQGITMPQELGANPFLPSPAWEFAPFISYSIRYSNGILSLRLATTDGRPNSPVDRFYVARITALSELTPNPTPSQGPIS